jgi:hypothetical protein
VDRQQRFWCTAAAAASKAGPEHNPRRRAQSPTHDQLDRGEDTHTATHNADPPPHSHRPGLLPGSHHTADTPVQIPEANKFYGLTSLLAQPLVPADGLVVQVGRWVHNRDTVGTVRKGGMVKGWWFIGVAVRPPVARTP